MPIHPLPQFEADLKQMLDEEDRRAYEALKAPKTLVVRFGAMQMVGEFPYTGDIKPGCGSKIVVRTHRGVELGEMLTSTCSNSGCGKSVSRKEMLGYIQNSGGRDYPFFQEGKVIRIATKDDLDRQSRQEQARHELKMEARSVAERIGSGVRIVDAEAILGDEVLTFFYLSEERIDVRELHHALSNHFRHRIDLKQVGARDEARLTADYERCGQYCCCKNFLKVLKPVSMKSAKVQKATLDPLKISGRCGRLMCCLRYEDDTYEDLKKRLPRKKSRVGTPEGDGLVMDSQILTQLVLVLLDEPGPDGKDRQVAIAVEDLTPPKNEKAPSRPQPSEPPRMGSRPPQGAGPRPAGERSPRPNEQRDGRPRQDNRPSGGPGPNVREGDRNAQRAPQQPRPERENRPSQPPRPQQSGPKNPAQPPKSGGETIDDVWNGSETDDGSGSREQRSADPQRRRRRRGRGGRGPRPDGPTPPPQQG